MYETVVEEWKNCGRNGKLRFVATNAFGLGPGAAGRGADQYRHYNQFLRAEAADQAAQRVLTSPEDIRKVIQEFEQVGLDEMVFLPQVTDLVQVDKLAEIVG